MVADWASQKSLNYQRNEVLKLNLPKGCWFLILCTERRGGGEGFAFPLILPYCLIHSRRQTEMAIWLMCIQKEWFARQRKYLLSYEAMHLFLLDFHSFGSGGAAGRQEQTLPTIQM